MSLNKKKLLIAGGGYADIPLIRAAKALGFHVITSGNRASDLGHAVADECVLEDFSDREAMLRLAKRLRIDAIGACCNDFSALSAAFVAENLGLPGHDTVEAAEIIHHKDRFREFATLHGIPSPRAEGFASEEDALRGITQFALPVLVKPVDLTGGKGISVVRAPEEAAQAIAVAFRRSVAKRVIIEEFVEGLRHGFSAMLVGGRVRFWFADNEHYFKNPYLVWAASTPTTAPQSAVDELIGISERIAALLALRDGIFHVQFILHEGHPVIIEICRRPPGDLYVRFVELATGADYPGMIVRAAVGMAIEFPSGFEPRGCFSRHCLMPDRAGRVVSVDLDPGLRRQIIDEMLWWKPDDLVEDPLTHKFGIVFVRYGSMSEMLDKSERLHQFMRVEWDGADKP
jgi:biotin carboxylase